MNSRRIWIPCCLLPALLSGCAGGNTVTLVRSEAQIQAANQLERGIRAQNKGEFQQSEKFLTDSLKISSSIEDNPARVIALVNLARLDRLHNRLGSAVIHIDQALTLAKGSSPLMGEAAYEKALIELAQNRITEALTWADTSLSSFSGESKGRIFNLLSRIHRAAGNGDKARSAAVMAREENHRNGQLAEEANSLRLLGSLEREEKKFTESGRFLLEALEIDKNNGESLKIAHDLEELAALSGDQGRLDMMLDYLERALTVHIAGERLLKGASIQLKIADIHRKTGSTDLAEKALQSAEKLRVQGAQKADK